MVQVVRVELIGLLPMVGQLEIVRAEWWKESPNFVLLRFAVNGFMRETGVRLDLDKRAILDSVDDPFLDNELQVRRFDIWKTVVRELPAALNA
jgi:hypothetical protein